MKKNKLIKKKEINHTWTTPENIDYLLERQKWPSKAWNILMSLQKKGLSTSFVSPIVSCKQLRNWLAGLSSAQADVNQRGGFSAAPSNRIHWSYE